MPESSSSGYVSNIPALHIPQKPSKETQRALYLLALLLSDVLMLGIAFWLAYWIRFQLDISVFVQVTPSYPFYQKTTLVLIGLWILLFYLFRLYDWENLLGGLQEYTSVANACTVATTLVVVTDFLQENTFFLLARGWLLLAWILTILFVSSGRFLLRRVVYGLRPHGYFVAPALVVGNNGEALALARDLSAWKTSGLYIFGVITDTQPVGTLIADHVRVIGSLKSLPDLVEKYRIEELVVATSALSSEQLLEIFRYYGVDNRVRLRLSSGLADVFTTGLNVKSMGSIPLISVNKVRLSPSEALIKGCLDRGGAAIGLLLLAPLLLAIAVAIKLDSPGPIIFRRRVLGCGGKPFDAYKFRTMVVDGDDLLTEEEQANLLAHHKLKEDPRVTRTGRFLRKYSLDELPQLLNVLRGQMSLIGPRIITQAEHGKYGRWDMNLLTVKPGLSGLWQVSGRSDISYEERVRLDMYYIRNYTLWLDLHLLIRTIVVVFTGKGAY